MKLQVNMRTMLRVVTLIAILVGWMADRYRLETRHKRDALELEKARVQQARLQAELNWLRLDAMKQNAARWAELSQQ